MSYDEFRTGMQYADVFALFWSGSDRPEDWRYKRRHTILGKWREIKQTLWAEHCAHCGASASEEIGAQTIEEY